MYPGDLLDERFALRARVTLRLSYCGVYNLNDFGRRTIGAFIAVQSNDAVRLLGLGSIQHGSFGTGFQRAFDCCGNAGSIPEKAPSRPCHSWSPVGIRT